MEAGECPQAFEHDSAGSYGYCLRPICGQALSDGIRVDEVMNSEGTLKQIRSACALAGTVGSGEHDGQWCPRGHIHCLCAAPLRLTTVQLRARSAAVTNFPPNRESPFQSSLLSLTAAVVRRRTAGPTAQG
jgi:hypothetical protein